MGERISSTSQNLTKFSKEINAPLPITFSSKAKSFSKIVSSSQKNAQIFTLDPMTNYADGAAMGANILLPQPLKHYRKEIANVSAKDPKLNYPIQPKKVSFDEMNQPGGYIMVNGYTPQNTPGLDKLYIDDKSVNKTNTWTEHPGLCKSMSVEGQGVCLDRGSIAKKRVRTSGIIKPYYCTTTKEYLNNRNKSFENNSYQFFQRGNTSAVPGSPDAIANTYRTQSYVNSTAALYDSSCNPPVTNVYYKPSNWKFSRQGAETASSMTQRRKFDTIVNNVARFKRDYGDAVGNAMGYGIANSVYTYKDKVGFPLPSRPKVKPNQILTCCKNTHILGGIKNPR